MTNDLAGRIADPAAVPEVLLAGASGLGIMTEDAQLGAVADAAVGPALMRALAVQVNEGTVGAVDRATLRLYRPPPTLAFTGRDVRAPGLPTALAAARAHGFHPVRRPQGGRAAALHRGSVCFDLVLPDRDASVSPVLRLAVLGTLLVRVLRELGVDARLGEVPDEYCPGEYSVNARGVVKLVGTAARRVRGAMLLGGVVLVEDPEPVRAVITDVYRALDLPYNPASVGAVAQEQPTAGGEAVTGALEKAFAAVLPTERAGLPAAARASALAAPDELG